MPEETMMPDAKKSKPDRSDRKYRRDLRLPATPERVAKSMFWGAKRRPAKEEKPTAS